MAKSSGPYQKVKVTDEISSGSQTPSFSGEYPADLFIQRNNFDRIQECSQPPLILLWSGRAEYPFIEFCERHYAQPCALWQ